MHPLEPASPTSDGVRWDAWHLHVADPGAGATDRVLCRAVAPAVDELKRRDPRTAWFYVRYWQSGPHVRLRVAGLDDDGRARLDRLVRTHLMAVLPDLPGMLTSAEYRRQAAPYAAAGEGGRPLDAGALRPAGVYGEVYTPEVARYGGAALMAVSESLFQTASEVALGFCCLSPPEAARSGLGLRATWAALAVLDDDRRLGFCRRAAAGWQSWITAGGGIGAYRVAALPAGFDTPPPAPVRRWVDQLGRALPVWRGSQPPATAERILQAHIHLLHNRLGLSVIQERNHYLALATALARKDELAAVAP